MEIKESCVDEVEPLHSIVSITPDSAISRCSSVSRRKPDYARRCILFLLINAVFVMAIFLAFHIGHWISRQNTHKIHSILKPTPLVFNTTNTLTTPLTTLPTLLTTQEPTTLTFFTTSSTRPRILERIIPLEKEERNFTLLDVFPPSIESYEFLEELHASREEGKDSILFPLPLYILPTHYELLLDLSRFSEERVVRGNLTVHLESYGNSSDDEILFHVGAEVNIERIRIRKEGKRVYPKTIKREDNKKMARLILRERLQKGRYLLDLEYNTTICQQEGGVHCFYDTNERNESIVTSFTTKFEPALARNFIPCWDEPGIKATFNITVLHHSQHVVLSNMPPVDDVDSSMEMMRSSRLVTTVFQETPPMSTYLLAFAVGNFQPYEMRTERNIPITIWTKPEDFLSARFAANFSPLMFDKHEDEMEVPYPLPKMDFVAARSFPVGGMENWGLVVFDSQALLLDQLLEDNINMTVDRLFQEYKIEKLVTHELSHQWFGNLVTMRDWSDLWLNEGFASYFVYDLLNEDHPKLTEHEYYTRLAKLVIKQSGHERKALVKEMRTERQVEKSFHTMHLYAKGCVIVKMIRDLISDFDFRVGVRRYLRKNAFRSVTREELWLSLPAHADHGADNERLSQVMEGWLVNPGLPEVTVTRIYENDMIRVSQRQAREHNHKAYLVDKIFIERLETYPSLRNKREASTIEETTPFDESLFDDMPVKWKDQMKKRRKNRKKKKNPRPTKKPSLPTRTITPDARREELRHRRRASNPSDVWSIPFSYMFGSMKSTEGQVVRQFWLKNRSLSFTDVELAPSQPLLANPDWSYPYRVNYDNANWKMLARLLHQNHHEVPKKSRMQLIVDAETFLGHSELPHLYFYLLGYLANESDLGVALIGLDAVHRTVDTWRGSRIINSLLLYVTPVIKRLDYLLKESQTDTELSALWLIEPSRLSKLYQLRCACNLDTCQQDHHAKIWLHYPTSAQEDVHKQVTAVCHYLYTNRAEKQLALLEALLKSRGTHWTTAIQLAACTNDERVARLAAKQIVSTRNAAIFAMSLQSDYNLHYNLKFRSALWHQIGKLSIEEKMFLFSINSTNPQPASKILVHSVRTLDELRQVRSLLPDWGVKMTKHVEYVDRKLQWMTNTAAGVLADFFNGNMFF